MQTISQNVITQKQHLSSKAVDIWNEPDPIIYAPEDVKFISFGQRGTPGTQNDAGLALRVIGDTGLHQFAHCEKTILKKGTAKRGEPIAVIGHTGYTKPPGAKGAHVHWWILQDDGSYVYPPSKVNQKFKKELGMVKPSEGQVKNWFKWWLSKEPTAKQIKYYTARDQSVLYRDIIKSNVATRKTIAKKLESCSGEEVEVTNGLIDKIINFLITLKR